MKKRLVLAGLIAGLISFNHALVEREIGVAPLIRPAWGQDSPSEEVIIRALQTQKRKTRSLRPSGPNEAIGKLLSARRTRGLNLQEREELFAAVADKPQIDIPVFFGFDSAKLTPEALTALNRLGKALASQGLRDGRFLVAGHTDGKGSKDYNLRLSQERAEAVTAYLVEHFGLTPLALEPVGYGSEQLRDASHPLADENRRVQVVKIDD